MGEEIYIICLSPMIRISRIAPLSLTFGINLLYQLRNQRISFSMALYKAFAIEGPSITPRVPNPFSMWIAEYSACVPTNGLRSFTVGRTPEMLHDSKVTVNNFFYSVD
jgi:hypothetical protein